MQTGPQSGLQTTLTQPQITFGREAGNVLVIQAPEVTHLSRQHGRVDLINNQWVLTNQSNNGTTVNGKKMKGDQQVLNPGDVVGVAKKPLFSVQFNPMDPYVPPVVAEEQQGVPGESALTQTKRKSGLWIGIGSLWAVVMVAIMIVMSTGGGNGGKKAPPLQSLSERSILDEIEGVLTRPNDDNKANESLVRAKSQFERRYQSPNGLYNTLYAYKEHLAYAGTDEFADPQDQVRFDLVRKELTDKFVRKYNFAVAKVDHKEWAVAEQSFKELRDIYPGDAKSRIAENIGKYIVLTKRNSPR